MTALVSVASRFRRLTNTLCPTVDDTIPGGRRNHRDRLSDLEAGNLAGLAYEDSWDDESSDDEAPPPSPGSTLTITLTRETLDESVGVEMDVWARHSAAAAECTIGWIRQHGLADGHLLVGDAIHAVNGKPCFTIQDVKAGIAGCHVMEFRVRRPKQIEIFSSAASLLMQDGSYLSLTLCLSSARVLELRPGGEYATTVLRVLNFASVSMRSGNHLQIQLDDGNKVMLRTATADLEKWHTLLTQLRMFCPDTYCVLTGWAQRTDDANNSPQRYFELYSTGTVLVYGSPHRNKLGQALCAVSLHDAQVERDPARASAWLVTDGDRDAVWRCDHVQPTIGNLEPETIFNRCVQAAVATRAE